MMSASLKARSWSILRRRTWQASSGYNLVRYLSPGKNLRQPFRQFSSTIPCLSTSQLDLSYDLHEPSHPRFEKHVSPIIFLHGLFGSKKNNRSISRALARDLGRYVYALDLRNHGESPHHVQHDYPAMAKDVMEFMHGHNLINSTIIGHSMGAKVAMTVALQFSNSVADIVAVDNAPIEANLGKDFASYIRGMKEIDVAGISRQAEADKILQRYEESLPIRQFLLGNLHRLPGETAQKFRVPLDILGRALDHMGDFPIKNPEVTYFRRPALFVRGTKSKYVPDDVIPIIGRFFPRFRIEDINAGHWLISEQPEEFRRVVVEFLKAEE